MRFRLVLLIGALASTALGAESALRIARFAGDRPAAISYTFDDGLRDQYTLAVPMLDEVGMKGTFFVIPGRVSPTVEDAERRKNDKRAWGTITWNELREMSAKGHEIASHTWSHPNLTALPADQVAAQIDQAADAIEKELGRPALTLAFPFNARTPEIEALARKRHVAFRSGQLGIGGKTTVESLDAWADKQIRDRAWGVIMFHAIGSGYAALSDPKFFQEHLRRVKARDKEIWVDTFANVARYEREHEDATLTVVSTAPGRLVFTLAGTLAPETYDVPLTVVIDLAGVRAGRAERAGRELPLRVGSDSIQIDARPAPEAITVTWN